MARKKPESAAKASQKKKLSPKGTPAPQSDPVLPNVNPAAEQHATPQTGLPFPICAVGASAGGLDAFNKLLKVLPADTGMGFVIIQHLAPKVPSLLAEILGRATRMPVAQVEDGVEVRPNHVYVIPPGKAMVLADGRLELSARGSERTQVRPIDHFMRSLAEEHGHKAIGIVLSGTGNDGTLGLEEIKAGGGIAFVQDDTAEHSGMPRSAIAGGAVDYVMSPPDIARELVRLARHPYVMPRDEDRLALNELDMQRILEVLRTATGVDFSNYKRNTLYRRISRRMVLHKLDGAREYLKMLQGTPGEVEALYQDVLINVTSFFRNPDAYEALKTQVFPRLTDDRQRHDPIRIWALGCSTGEEAYSLAIAFSEYLESAGKRFTLQVFATDLNGAGIEKARSGIYGKGITQDVSAERLRRYFVEIDGTYRIAKPIRDMCVFARQNVLADPPFSRIDLIACRNMLIYLEPVLQQRLIPLLHYALRGDGFLWLGSSETIGSHRDLFEMVDAKSKIYGKKVATRGHATVPMSTQRWAPPYSTSPPPAREPAPDTGREADRLLLLRYAPPAVVVNETLEIVQFRGDTSPYLRPAPGKATLNLLKMLREGLMVGVRGALARARKEGTAREEGMRVRSNGGWRTVDVIVLPLKGSGNGGGSTTLVLFEEPAPDADTRVRQLEADARAAAASQQDAEGGEQEVARLKQELGATRDYLQSVIEQQEAANEELQSANEEVQSANEELQSINEELETSKEEIQSSNEELATVNDELQNRNLELSQSNNDLTNLLASVQMAIVMLGSDLRIRRFTPTAEKLLNLIPADVGRPIGDIKLNLSLDDLEGLLLESIDSVTVHEREVQVRGGRWYSLRVRPYRTLENKIDGAVLMLVDIDELKKAELALREAEARLAQLEGKAS